LPAIGFSKIKIVHKPAEQVIAGNCKKQHEDRLVKKPFSNIFEIRKFAPAPDHDQTVAKP
jgi:hypothetical protein